jgi:hypothetical protein
MALEWGIPEIGAPWEPPKMYHFGMNITEFIIFQIMI